MIQLLFTMKLSNPISLSLSLSLSSIVIQELAIVRRRDFKFSEIFKKRESSLEPLSEI